MKKYRISKEANIDLNEIWLYTYENWSKKQADYYYSLLIAEIEHISAEPNSGKNISNIAEGYWRTKVKHHLIFYKLGTEYNVEVIRILHEKMDIENKLKG